jgi:hypothetical protein
MCLYIFEKQVRGKPVAVYSFAGTVGKSFSNTFTKHNTENVTGIYPINCINEDEFLSSFVTDRSYLSGDRTHIALTDFKDNTDDTNQERFTGSMKICPEVIKPTLMMDVVDMGEESMEEVGS